MPAVNNVICHLECALEFVEPVIRRRLHVPADMPLDLLHVVLQIAFGWQNSHLHQFTVGKTRYVNRLVDEDADADCQDENAVAVGELLRQLGDSMQYEYDFGDGWLHSIVLQGMSLAEPGVAYPRCVDGARSGPPEDCGGPPAYSEYLAYLKDPEVPVDEEFVEWMGAFDPEAFSLADVNVDLAGVFAPRKAVKKAAKRKRS